jgi:hypothetical protein
MLPLFELVEASEATPGPLPLKVGGAPDWIAPTAWPTCKTCEQPMGFRFQLANLPAALDLSPYGAIYVFQCDNPFFRCRPFDAMSGANAVVPQTAVDGPFEKPEPKPSEIRERLMALHPATEDEEALSIDVDSASPEQIAAYEKAQEEAPSSKLGGVPVWLQGPEFPTCCGKPMAFLAQLDGATWDLPFGDGGAGYVFRCQDPNCQDARFRFSTQSF